jgi:hypothetical protein
VALDPAGPVKPVPGQFGGELIGLETVFVRAHGERAERSGFEKGRGATIYLHPPGVGAIPVGLTAVRTARCFP